MLVFASHHFLEIWMAGWLGWLVGLAGLAELAGLLGLLAGSLARFLKHSLPHTEMKKFTGCVFVVSSCVCFG